MAKNKGPLYDVVTRAIEPETVTPVAEKKPEDGWRWLMQMIQLKKLA